MNYELTIYAIDHVSTISGQLELNFYNLIIGSQLIPLTITGEKPITYTFDTVNITAKNICDLRLLRKDTKEEVLSGTITLQFEPDAKKVSIASMDVQEEDGKQLTAQLEGLQTITFLHTFK